MEQSANQSHYCTHIFAIAELEDFIFHHAVVDRNSPVCVCVPMTWRIVRRFGGRPTNCHVPRSRPFPKSDDPQGQDTRRCRAANEPAIRLGVARVRAGAAWLWSP